MEKTREQRDVEGTRAMDEEWKMENHRRSRRRTIKFIVNYCVHFTARTAQQTRENYSASRNCRDQQTVIALLNDVMMMFSSIYYVNPNEASSCRAKHQSSSKGKFFSNNFAVKSIFPHLSHHPLSHHITHSSRKWFLRESSMIKISYMLWCLNKHYRLHMSMKTR